MAEGEFALVQEELESALSLEGQPVKRGTMAHEHIIYMMLADTAAQAEKEEAIDRYLDKLEPLVSRDEHRPYQAIAHRARGVSQRVRGDFDEAEASLNHAVEFFYEYGSAWQLGRTYCEMAKLSVDRADDKSAYNQYLQALTQFEKIQALPDLKRTRAALDAVESAA
jgi:tetratricopeptide (TPR) repeat protein